MTTSSESELGVLLVGHGTRDRHGLDEFMEVVRQVSERQQPQPVEAAFLELAQPTIPAGVARLYDRGVRRMIAAPLLLFAAGHAKRDIPAAIAEGASRFPDLVWRQRNPLGCHPELLALSVERFRQAVAGRPVPDKDSLLIVVGRGSLDADATAETHRYAELLANQVGVNEFRVAFLAMATPRLRDVLNQAAAERHAQMVVQPHLLFHGELLEQIHQEVATRKAHGGKEWIVTEHLGADPRVVNALGDLRSW